MGARRSKANHTIINSYGEPVCRLCIAKKIVTVFHSVKAAKISVF